MAQTFLGRLVLALQDNMSGKAKTTATSVNQSLNSIERNAKRLGGAAWGANFQNQLNKLGASRSELNQINSSWNRLHDTIKTKGLNKALAGSEIRAWRAATLSHLADVRSGWRKTEQEAQRTARSLQNSFGKSALFAMGGYSAFQLGGTGIREGFFAGSERRREQFRQDMASLTDAQKVSIDARSTALSQRFPSVSKTDVEESARITAFAMGDVDRGLQVLDHVVQSLVTLQSTKGGEVAVREVTGFLRGLDKLGVNKNGAEGVKQVNDMLEAMARASQIEGADFDAGAFWSFAKRLKVAGPALSQEFLAIAPALMQDMGSDSAGNAIAMAFKAFVLEAVGSAGGKKYLAERQRIGIRNKDGLIDAELFGKNPIEWTRKNLVPALVKDGIDMKNETAIAAAVGKLSGNTNATGLLTQLITQAEQIDRLKELYSKSIGLEAASRAATEDPFVAYQGFKSAWTDMSAAVLPMDTISKGLTGMAGAIKRAAAAFEDGDPLARAGIIGGAAVGVGAPVFFLSKAVYGLITAGTNLNAAAVMLERAAIAQRGGDLLDGKGGKVGKAAGVMGWLAAVGKAVGVGGTLAVTADVLGDTPGDTMESKISNQAQYRQMLERLLGINQGKSDQTSGKADPFASGAYLNELRSTIPSLAGDGTRGGLSDIVNQARQAGSEVQSALSVDAKPNVDLTGIQAFRREAEAALAVLRQMGSAVSEASAGVDAEMRRSMADYGVAP